MLPQRLKSGLRYARWRWNMRRAVRRLRALPPGEIPSRELILSLRTAWENPGYAGDIDYLVEIARQAGATTGPILECGSGLSTILLSAVAGRRGVAVWSLEHDPAWRKRTALAQRLVGSVGTRLCLAPLRDYGNFSWYDPPVAEMPDGFTLVVCDGPPETTPGGRYGLIPVMGRKLAPRSLVLVDDAMRASEVAMLERWKSEWGAAIELRRPAGRPYALVTRQ